jgi:hypothetical protein
VERRPARHRLHALIDPNVREPADTVRAALAQARVTARVDVADASLEDVFRGGGTRSGTP